MNEVGLREVEKILKNRTVRERDSLQKKKVRMR